MPHDLGEEDGNSVVWRETNFVLQGGNEMRFRKGKKGDSFGHRAAMCEKTYLQNGDAGGTPPLTNLPSRHFAQWRWN